MQSSGCDLATMADAPALAQLDLPDLAPASLLEEVAALQRTIVADMPFTAVSDIITANDDRIAISIEPNIEEAKPLTYARLQKFIASADLRRFGIGNDDIVCTAIRNGAEANLCFWAITEQCVFAPLNANLT